MAQPADLPWALGQEPPSGADLPTEDGEPMETQRHRDQMTLLIESLQLGVRERPLYVSGNMFVYFSKAHARTQDFRGPDVFVVLDVSPHERKSWVVWEEGGRAPDIIIELTSESTAQADYGTKKDLYAQALRVPEYFIFDPWSKDLVGFTLDLPRRRYRQKDRSPEGHLSVDSLDLGLAIVEGSYHGTRTGWLRWLRKDGSVLATGEELAEQQRQFAEQQRQLAEQQRQLAEQQRQLAEQQRQLAERGEQRVAALEAQLRALGVEPSGQ